MKKMKEAGGNRQSIGKAGEELAARYLEENDFVILERNFRFGKMGEIDIIAREAEYICFIEVKTRTTTIYGSPSEAVNWKKQQGILRLSQVYLNRCGLNNSNVRFDVVEILNEKINLIRNAFY